MYSSQAMAITPAWWRGEEERESPNKLRQHTGGGVTCCPLLHPVLKVAATLHMHAECCLRVQGAENKIWRSFFFKRTSLLVSWQQQHVDHHDL